MSVILEILIGTLSPLVVGLILWLVGEKASERRLKADAIRELTGYRGDYGSTEFGRALNKVSVVFNDDDGIRLEVRNLYERINTSPNSAMTKRSIVGLIYKLCQKNGFRGLSEYDIDQAFPENKQEPQPTVNVVADKPNPKEDQTKNEVDTRKKQETEE